MKESNPYNQESGCIIDNNDYYSQTFEINFTIVLESSNNTLGPITLTGSIIDFPINPNAGAC